LGTELKPENRYVIWGQSLTARQRRLYQIDTKFSEFFSTMSFLLKTHREFTLIYFLPAC